jgi:hypothetical protein
MCVVHSRWLSGGQHAGRGYQVHRAAAGRDEVEMNAILSKIKARQENPEMSLGLFWRLIQCTIRG